MAVIPSVLSTGQTTASGSASSASTAREVQVQALQEVLAQRVPGARLLASVLPDCGELSLYLLQEDYPHDALSREQALGLMDEPPYWVFCWASGWVMAQYVLARPTAFAGKTLLDFGCGSAIAGIAAARVGATVTACDVDEQALQIARCNAELNGVSLGFATSIEACAEHYDIIVAADVLYDQDNFPLLETLSERSDSLLIADSRIKQWLFPGFEKVLAQDAHTLPDLDEGQDYREVRVYRSL